MPSCPSPSWRSTTAASSRGAAPSASWRALEGERTPKRLVIIEFPSVERAQAWLESPEYAPARRLRQCAARSNTVVVEGYAPA